MSKTIVITGSTRGIGFGMAAEFLKRGHNVVVSGRSQGAVEKAVAELAKDFESRQVLGQPCDVTRLEQVEALWQAAVTRFGRVDIWINNAGIGHPMVPVWELSPKTVDTIIQTNIMGTYNGCRVAISEMLKLGGGQIYNMEGFGSNGRVRGGISVYGASKSATTFLTRSLADELKATPVIIGTLQPGMVATDLLTDQYKEKPEEWARVKRIFNIIAERVETVAPFLVDRILANQKNDAKISFMSQAKLVWRFTTAPFIKRNVFDD